MAQTTAAPTTTLTQEAFAQNPTVALTPASYQAHGRAHLLMIVPFDEGELQAQAMENWFQASASDEPFALELAGNTREQVFLLRASSKPQLTLLRKQFEAQYPQAEILPVDPAWDPLIVRPGEGALIGEFALARPSWMPLKTFSGKALAEPGGDPLAHILASMEGVGAGQRVIAQLALQRAPDSWIAPDIRKAVEHPLQEERDAAAASLKGAKGAGATSDTAEGLKIVLLLAGLFAAFFGYRWYQEQAWLQLGSLALALLAGGIGLLWWWIRQGRRHIYDMKLVSEKLMRQAFYCQLRVIVIGKLPPPSAEEQRRRQTLAPEDLMQAEQAEHRQLAEQLRVHLSRLEVAYRQFSLASANSLILGRTRYVSTWDRRALALPRVSHVFPYQHWLPRLLHDGPTKCVLNGQELAGAFHLPQAFTDLPLVKRTSVKRLLFSPEVSRQIEQAPAPQKPMPIGYSRHRGHDVKVLIPFLTQFSNKFLIGRSRSGKSMLIQLLSWGAMQLVGDGSLQPGYFGIDPHRDLAEDLLRLIPPERTGDVLLLDFTDTQFPVALNPLDASMGFTRDQAVSNLMSAFERIWHETWGPRMSYFLNSVCLLLYTLNERLVRDARADEQYTLLDINPLLQYKDYAAAVLGQLDMSETWHQELMAWWQHTVWPMPASFRQEVIMPILSKMGVFSNNQLLRRIVGQPVTNAPVHEAITAGKIVLCSLSSRDMDDTSVNILGSTLLNLLHATFRLQQEIPLPQRRRVFVAVDEFQNFSGSAFDKLLSEDAKFGCAMLMATQNLKRLNQVKEGLLEVVMSNCQNVFAFNMSAADARLLEEEFQEKVLLKDFISQPRLHCYARLALERASMQIASVLLKQPASWDASPARLRLVQAIRDQNRQGKPGASKVDDQRKRHLERFLDVALFAEHIGRQASAIAANKQRRADENALNAPVTGEEGESTPLLSSVLPAASSVPETPHSRSGADSAQPSQDHTTQSNGQIGAMRPQPGEHESDGKRNNPRSRRLSRLKKNPVGIPPPTLTGEPDDQNPRPLPFPSGRSRGGFEGREREPGS